MSWQQMIQGQLSVADGAAGQAVVGATPELVTQWTTEYPTRQPRGTERDVASTYSIKVLQPGLYRLAMQAFVKVTDACEVTFEFYRTTEAGVTAALGAAKAKIHVHWPNEDFPVVLDCLKELEYGDKVLVYVTTGIDTTVTVVDGQFIVTGVAPNEDY